MKKVLFATSALVLTAGFAVAEVAVSGDGRMGMIYDGDDAQFSSRARVLFTLTGESDSGLSFGGKFRVDQENYSANPGGRSAAKGSAGSVWISGTYGKLSMGDVVSATEAAIGDLYEIGYTDGEFANDIEELSFLVGDGNNKDQGPTILYEYSIDNFSFYASATDGSDTAWYSSTGANNHNPDPNATNPALTGDRLSDEVAYSLAAKYDAGNWNAALSYAKHGDASEIGLGVEGQFDAFTAKAVYLSYDDVYGNASHDGKTVEFNREFNRDSANANIEMKHTIGLAAAYEVDAWTIKGFWRQDKFEAVTGSGSEKLDSYGIGADYDLGGGATLAGGVVKSDWLLKDKGTASDDPRRGEVVADLGIKFKF